jgi:hypothetical protein
MVHLARKINPRRSPYTNKDARYNEKALVPTLEQIHDELDAAVLDALRMASRYQR